MLRLVSKEAYTEEFSQANSIFEVFARSDARWCAPVIRSHVFHGQWKRHGRCAMCMYVTCGMCVTHL